MRDEETEETEHDKESVEDACCIFAIGKIVALKKWNPLVHSRLLNFNLCWFIKKEIA